MGLEVEQADHRRQDDDIGDQLEEADALQEVAKPAWGGVPTEAQGTPPVPVGQPGGKEDDQGDLPQLRGLPPDGVAQPPGGAAGLHSQAGDLHRQHQQEGQHQDGHGQPLEPLVVQQGDNQHHSDPGQGDGPLAGKVIKGVAVGVPLQVIVGRGVRGRQQHHQADGHQHDGEHQEGHVDAPPKAAHPALPRRHGGAGLGLGPGFQNGFWHERIPPGSAFRAHRAG